MAQKQQPKAALQDGQYAQSAQPDTPDTAPMYLGSQQPAPAHTLVANEAELECSCGNTDLYAGDNDGAFLDLEGHAATYLCLDAEPSPNRRTTV